MCLRVTTGVSDSPLCSLSPATLSRSALPSTSWQVKLGHDAAQKNNKATPASPCAVSQEQGEPPGSIGDWHRNGGCLREAAEFLPVAPSLMRYRTRWLGSMALATSTTSSAMVVPSIPFFTSSHLPLSPTGRRCYANKPISTAFLLLIATRPESRTHRCPTTK